MTTYRIEFGMVRKTYPVPPITLKRTDPTEFCRAVAVHAIPYLKPVLAEMGRPELAHCFFRHDRDLKVGAFMWVNLAGDQNAQFCTARLTPTDLDPDICGDANDDEVCELEPGHDGDHLNGHATIGWPNRFTQPAAR
jgi:hypothetical protein